jgi:hypothetical protein
MDNHSNSDTSGDINMDKSYKDLFNEFIDYLPNTPQGGGGNNKQLFSFDTTG